MSWWRKTTVLRIPASKLGIQTRRQWNEFLKAHQKDFDWRPGHFDESLADDYPTGLRWKDADFENPDWRLDQRNPDHPEVVPGPFLDYKIEEIEPLSPNTRSYGVDDVVLPLDDDEKEEYLPIFRSLFPNFSLQDMDAVRYCSYEWYDGSNAMYLYSDYEEDPFEKWFS